MMHSTPSLALLTLLLWWSVHTLPVSGLVGIPLPQVVLTMRSSSPDTNTHDLLTHTMRQSTAFLDDYFTSYYNTTLTLAKYGFDHVSVSVKSYGVVPTASSIRYKTSVQWFGTVYYKKSGEQASQVKMLIEYALNDQNRVAYIDRFLKKAFNPFLQNITFMEVLVDGVMDGSPLPPLPQPVTTSSNSSSQKDTNTAIGLTTALVILCVLAVIVAVFVIRRRRRQYKHPLTPPQRNYGPVGINSHPAFSFGRRSGESGMMAAKALGSPSALRADRDEEIAPHRGGQRGASVLFSSSSSSSSSRHRQTVAASDDIDVATLPANHKEASGRSPSSKGSFSFSKWQSEDVSQYSSVAMDVEAWKHFSSTSPPPKMPPPPTDPMKLATQVNAMGSSSSSAKKASPSNVVSPKAYTSPTWTSQNRFHFDIDEEDDDGVEEWRVIS